MVAGQRGAAAATGPASNGVEKSRHGKKLTDAGLGCSLCSPTLCCDDLREENIS